MTEVSTPLTRFYEEVKAIFEKSDDYEYHGDQVADIEIALDKCAAELAEDDVTPEEYEELVKRLDSDDLIPFDEVVRDYKKPDLVLSAEDLLDVSVAWHGVEFKTIKPLPAEHLGSPKVIELQFPSGAKITCTRTISKIAEHEVNKRVETTYLMENY